MGNPAKPKLFLLLNKSEEGTGCDEEWRAMPISVTRKLVEQI